MRFALAAVVLLALAPAVRAGDAREEVRTGVLRAIGWGIAFGPQPELVDPLWLPSCGDPADLRTPLPDARAPWRAGYPHVVRSEAPDCLAPRIDGPRHP